jgi:diketogulonate reductase-like aldo/keto reductase
MSFCDTDGSADADADADADTEWTDHPENHDGVDETTTTKTHQYYSKMPLDVYYIHAPACWKGWHTQCDHPPHTMDLRSVWLAMEAVVGLDHSARRIGLSNVRTDELLDIIHFVQERQKEYSRASSSSSSTGGSNAAAISRPPPRLPDVVQSFADPIEPAIEIRKICAQYQIEFVSYSTLGTQHVYKSTNPSRSNPVLTHPTIVQLAEQYQRSTAEIVLSWALQNQMSIIPRSSQKVHIQQLARLLPNSFQEGPVGFLTANDLAQIDLMKA